MSLADDQARFTELLIGLLWYGAHGRKGYRARIRDAGRSPEEQARLMQLGASLTMNSGHRRYCAVDLVVDRQRNDGPWVTSWDFEDYRPLGEFWEKLDPACIWGGSWPTLRDAGHFEYKP